MAEKLTKSDLDLINRLEADYKAAQDALLETEEALESSDVFKAREAAYAALEKAEVMFMSAKNMVLAKYGVNPANDQIDASSGEILRDYVPEQSRLERIQAYKLERQRQNLTREAVRLSRNKKQ